MQKIKARNMKRNWVYFATGCIPDGYSGDTATVSFAYDPVSWKTVVMTKSGWFYYQTPPASSVYQALWLLNHHPHSNAKSVFSSL